MVEFCSDSSRAAGEPLAGTASSNEVYFLLEYRQAWTPKAVKPGNNTLTGPVTEHIQTALKASGRKVKPMFIRQQGTPADAPLTAFIAFPTETDPTVYRLSLNSYDDLLDLPLVDMLSGEIDELLRYDGPLVTVCAHKERDRACGRDGWAVYTALREQLGEGVWQSTHIGGHRFAATLIAFPSGTVYGHLDPADVEPLVAAERDGRMLTNKARGRSCYEKPVQAADIALRQAHGLDRYDALRLLDVVETGVDEWTVRFDVGGTEQTLPVREVEADYKVVTSTGDDEPSTVKILAAEPTTP